MKESHQLGFSMLQSFSYSTLCCYIRAFILLEKLSRDNQGRAIAAYIKVSLMLQYTTCVLLLKSKL